MILNINNESFELSTKLGTTKKMEFKFKKPYMKLLNSIEDTTSTEQIEMLVCGLISENGKENKEEADRLKNAILEEGLGNLSEYLEEFIDGLQYPGLSAEEIERKKLEKMKKQKHMKEIGLIN